MSLLLFISAGAQPASTELRPEVVRYQLEGIVVNSVTSEAISHALVEVVEPVYQATVTDAEGRFDFENLPAGSARLVVQKPGFVGTGICKTLNRNQLVVEVGPQGSMAAVRLAPEGVIAGRLVDQDKAAIEGAVLSLIRADILDGRKRWQRLPINVTTDIDGNFRFAELGSGDYWIMISTRNLTMPLETGERYAELSYYPGNPMFSSNALEMAVGQHAQVEVSLQRTPVYHVSGTIRGTNFARQISVRVLDPGGEALSFPVHFDAQGRFQIEKIPAGRYLIRNEVQDVSGHIFFSKQEVTVDSNIADLRITLTPPVSIPVYVRSELADNSLPCSVKASGNEVDCPRFTESTVTIVLHATKPFQEDVQSVFDSRQDPRLKVSNVDAGEYLVSIRSSLGYVGSIRCGGVDLLRERLLVQAGVPILPIEVTLRDGAASVSGSVRSEKAFGQVSVVLVPEFAPAQTPIVVDANPLGGFSQQGLMPGDYKVFAFDNVKNLEYANAEALSRYASQARRITLSSNADRAMVVNLIETQDQ